jgi:hypothetical protein
LDVAQPVWFRAQHKTDARRILAAGDALGAAPNLVQSAGMEIGENWNFHRLPRISWQVSCLPLLRGVESSMRKTIGLACALVIGTLSLNGVAAQAQGQEQCGPHDQVVKVLNAKYQESQRATGLINEKAMMEVYISSRGTWTMVVTNEAGISCVLAAGEAWDELPVKILGQSS